MKTSDGGENWTNQNSGTSNLLSAICFTDFNTGYAVGNFGTIIKTTDGGGTGLDESNDNSNFLITYPNPTRDIVTIETPIRSINEPIYLYDIFGQELMKREITGSKTEIDISNMSPGIYIITLNNGKKVLVGKIVKQ